MTTTARSIIANAIIELQDDTNVRWTIAELCTYFNDGQKAIAMARPDSMVKTATVALIVGSRQTLPADGVKLIDIPRNTSGTKRAVRMVNREILDAQVPGWHGLTGVTEIKHFTHDMREPLVFYTYPPAALGASLEVTYGSKATDITVPAAGAVITDVNGDMSLPDQYANPMRDYILFRAYCKDTEYTANAGRADKHLALFAEQLGIELAAARMVAPNPTANPNMVTQRTPAAAA